MYRKIVCLNGEWDFMPVYGVKACLDLPERLSFEEEKIRVPSSWRYMSVEGSECFGKVGTFEPFNMFDYPGEWSKADTGIYRRTFVIPDNMLGSKLFLRFDAIMQRSRVYLNGKPVVDWEEAYLPLKAEISDKIYTNGQENELIVVCTTFEEVDIPSGEKKSLGLLGSWYGRIGRGIWQDVFLESYPEVYIEDIFVKTSVRNSSLTTTIDIENKAVATKELVLKVSVVENGIAVKRFEEMNFIIDAKVKRSINLEEKWADAKLWNPDNPYLYNLKVDLLEKDILLDTKSIRFGFREIWVEGHKFVLNGTRINLRGDSWHFQGANQMDKEYALNWFKMCKDKGLNFIRLHAEPHPEVYLEAADEIGMLIVDETTIYGSSKAMPADHPVYLDRCKKHVERLCLRDRNHPSVILWSLQNEMRWVDGRDVYKLHIPEMMEIIRSIDGTRPILLEGDNRLLPKDKSEVESYHYNIDGTIGQWDKKRPLMFGEHGGWWYICPQNSSAYIGLKAYEDTDFSVQGLALKERLYVEYARESDVSGITSFNFAHYMMKSMPDEDVYLNWERLDTPGCKPKVIRKHSLTLNNGYLKDYPRFRPNPAMEILESCYKAVTIIPSEYDTWFFDDKEIVRNFNVYNDTLENRDCKVEFAIRLDSGKVIFQEDFKFIQEPGEKKTIKVQFFPGEVIDKEVLHLEAVLYHATTQMHRLTQTYKLYPEFIKTKPVDDKGRRVAFYGTEKDFKIIRGLLPKISKIKEINDITSANFDVLILGSYINDNAENYQGILGEFTAGGGILIQMEQFKFASGDISLVKQSFFSAHINDSGHNILQGLGDEDLIFWKPYIIEETPENIILQSFIKPVNGDVKMILECSCGDFGDGGDFWTPLMEIGYKKGTAILNQLEIMENYEKVPQACVLLRNILNYSFSLALKHKLETALLAEADGEIHKFVRGLDLELDLIDEGWDFTGYKNILADLSNVNGGTIERLSNYVKGGGNLILLKVQKKDVLKLEKLLEAKVRITGIPTYHLSKTSGNKVLMGISPVDLYRFEKVPCSPRLVENLPICENTIEIEGAVKLLESVTGTAWFDYFVGWDADEYSRIAIVDINRKNVPEKKSYMVEQKLGKGSLIVSQISTNLLNEKDIRIYSRLLANLGIFVNSRIFSYIKGHKDYSADYIMTLPYEEYNDYDTTEKYYIDKEYSLNNLGEGLYGWMKKVEKDPKDGFINLIDSVGKRYFLTCFVDYVEDRSIPEPQPDSINCMMDLDVNCSFKLWINGVLVFEHSKISEGIIRVIIDNIDLKKGLNRFVIASAYNNEDIKLRPVFKNRAGSFLNDVKYQLTIDEVDPK